MGSQSLFADPADDDEGRGEEKSFGEGLQSDRCADSNQVFHLAPRDHPSAGDSQVPAPVGLSEHGYKETYRHESARDQRRPSCTLGTHRLEAPITIDKYPVQTDIQQVAPHRDYHRHEGVAESLEELLGETEQQKRDDGEHY